MARKNLLASITVEKLTTVNSPGEGNATSEAPVSTPPLAFAGRGALGAVTRTIDDLAARAQAASDLEARLTSGEIVIDLDPNFVDASFVADRLGQDDEDFLSLVAAIAARGQDSPILVRPHPQVAGRFQVAFGHRRLRAAQQLGRPVRAVIKPLTDRDLVVAQGQENSARANLSFIERSLFAKNLEDRGYDRETIMTALGVDKTVVSRMISVATKIPLEIIQAIGSAPSTGRDRWVDLSTALQSGMDLAGLADAMAASEFVAASSDDRFNLVFESVSGHSNAPMKKRQSAIKARGAGEQFWSSPEGVRVARVTTNDQAFVFSIDQRKAPGFGDFLLEQMDRLFQDFTKNPRKE